jgi:hypothetical protein
MLAEVAKQEFLVRGREVEASRRAFDGLHGMLAVLADPAHGAAQVFAPGL